MKKVFLIMVTLGLSGCDPYKPLSMQELEHLVESCRAVGGTSADITRRGDGRPWKVECVKDGNVFDEWEGENVPTKETTK